MRGVTRLLLVLALAACTKSPDAQSLADVKREDLVIGVVVEGELAAVDSTDIKPPAVDMWDFKIAMLAPEGIDVKEGQPIAGFDTTEQTRQLEQMQNDTAQAQKQLEKKTNDARLARRTEELTIAEAEATLRKATLKATAPDDLTASVDRKQVLLDEQSAKIALEQTRTRATRQARSDDAEIAGLAEKRAYAAHRAELLASQIPRMVVKAPRAGTLVYPSRGGGEKKKVGDNAWRLENILQVVGLGKMVANGRIDEVDIAKVAGKQQVSLRLDALPDVQLHGVVESIAKSVQPRSQTDPSKMISLKVTLDATTAPLRPGMRFRGLVETTRLASVVQIPTDAVFVTADGPVAYRVTGDRVAKVKIALGQRSGNAVEIKAGLAPGDRVSRIDPERASR